VWRRKRLGGEEQGRRQGGNEEMEDAFRDWEIGLQEGKGRLEL
jgi:hypothetical protein